MHARRKVVRKAKKSYQNTPSNDKSETIRKNVEKSSPWAPFWEGVGRLLGILGALVCLLGVSWAPLGASWALLGASWQGFFKALFLNWSKMLSKTPSGSIWGRFGSGFGRVWVGFGQVFGVISTILERAAALSLLGPPTQHCTALHSPAQPCTALHSPTQP